jgi:hypothetical protein
MAEPAQDSTELQEAIAAVQWHFVQLVRASNECDLLCRVASFTHMVYGSMDKSVVDNDTPQKLSERVKFVRQLGEEMSQTHDEWKRTVQKYSRKAPRVGDHVWYCPRCGGSECSGALPARLFSAEQGGIE